MHKTATVVLWSVSLAAVILPAGAEMRAELQVGRSVYETDGYQLAPGQSGLSAPGWDVLTESYSASSEKDVPVDDVGTLTVAAGQEISASVISAQNAPVAAQGYGEPEESAPLYRKEAEQGEAGAQFNLGMMYANGQSVMQDYREAVKWLRKAAEQGHPKAQYQMGRMYIKGQGVAYNYALAVKWFSKAAAQDNADIARQKESLRRTTGFR